MNLGDDENKLTTVLFGSDARSALYKGLKTAADAVGCTMGPKGKCVIIQAENTVPTVTKDGVSVAKAINLKDPVQRMGAQLICEAASRTNDVAGDGTTTATVLTEEMVTHGLKLLETGHSSVEMRRGLEIATKCVVGALNRIAKNVSTNEEVAQIGTISANGDSSIGKLIADAMDKVGRDGIITVEDAKGMQTSMEVVEGMQFDRGFLSPYFVTNAEKQNVVYNDAFVLVTDKKLSTIKDLIPMLESVKQQNRPLLIIADEIENEVLQTLILNRIHGQFKVVAIKAPGYGAVKDAVLQDIATMAGANYFNNGSAVALTSARAEHLGLVKKITVDAKSTTIVASGKTAGAIGQRVKDLKAQLEDVTLTADEQNILKARIAKLSSGVAVIKVGGATEMEMTEKKYRIEDALNATKAAVEEGIVPGGGVALLNAARALDELDNLSTGEMMGVSIVRKACEAPVRKIVQNAGKSADVVIEKLRTMKAPMGFNAAKDSYGNLIEEGVIDPVKVTRCALENAASVASTFLQLDAVIAEDSK